MAHRPWPVFLNLIYLDTSYSSLRPYLTNLTFLPSPISFFPLTPSFKKDGKEFWRERGEETRRDGKKNGMVGGGGGEKIGGVKRRADLLGFCIQVFFLF